MITPFFKLEQDEQFLTVTIKVKYVRISEVEFFIEKNNFRFSLKPYFLNLYFSHNLKDTEKNSSKYDVDNGILTCRVEKEIFGEIFENLDLLSNLIHDKNISNKANPSLNIVKIKEIQNGMNNLNLENNNENQGLLENYQNAKNRFLIKEFTQDNLNDIYFEYLSSYRNKNVFPGMKISKSENLNNFSYGFNNQFNDVFTHRQEEMLEISDLNPEKIQTFHRYFEKMSIENENFIPERYIGDLNLKDENPEIFNHDLQKIFAIHIKKNPLESLFTEKEQSLQISLSKVKLSIIEEDEIFHDANNQYMSNLNNLLPKDLDIIFTKQLKIELYLQVIDILFAYLYDFRINDFEQNSESGWCINKLSNVFSCHLNFKYVFFSFTEEPPFNLFEELVRHLLIASYRRVICYPLYRNLELCEKIRSDDLTFIIENGKSYIIKSLLNVRIAFERSEPRFILNEIYVDQLIRWMNISNDSIWSILANYIKSPNIRIEKDDLKMNLSEIEEEYI